jgi:hypothetical protein
MSSNKIMLKDQVLSKGGGARRVILDYTAGLIYSYLNPGHIVGVYESGKGWITLKSPAYHQGGWGNPSTGDADGYHTIENARSLVRAIQGKLFEVNLREFTSQSELDKLNKEIAESNRLIEARSKIAGKLGRNYNDDRIYPLESVKVESLRGNAVSPKGRDVIKIAETYNGAVKVFTERTGREVKVDSYTISADHITQGNTVVAFRDAAGQVFMNSQVLGLSNFEREFMGSQSLIQSEVRKVAKYNIPFNVLAAAGLKLSETRVIETGPEETFSIITQRYGAPLEERHFTGALLLENDGRKFFMDVDREEIKHKLFNVFFVEVDSKVKSISEAYESMKPQEVRDAERSGTEVQRQGEWFFIKTDKTLKVLSENVIEWDRSREKNQVVLKHLVSHGKGRPNSLYKPVGFGDLDQYVCGTVRHSGREHRDLDLGQDEVTSSGNGDYTTFTLWRLIPNTTVANFTIEGDVD